MTIDDELAQLGEPPVSQTERTLIALLEFYLEQRAGGETSRLKESLAFTPHLPREGEDLLHAMERMLEWVQQLGSEDWHAVVLELDHKA